MTRGAGLLLAALVIGLPLGGCGDEAPSLDSRLRVDQLQARGTHNSYHWWEEEPALEEWRYRHAPLDVQLGEQGIRQLELDVHLMRESDALEVFHIPGFDAGTTCQRFTDCLEVVRAWSAAHPRHVPICIYVEPKDDAARVAAELGNTVAERLLTGEMGRIDEDIRAVFPPAQLLTPDDLQGDYASLRERLDAEGWPTLAEARGTVFFVLLDHGDLFDEYTAGGTTLAGRAMFASGDPEDPWAAVAQIDNPVSGADRIAAAVAAHLLVRTRADTEAVGDPE
ncbi:MAG: hypothetical protein EP329_16495, partial [Deltaproteobacteria bacterium]